MLICFLLGILISVVTGYTILGLLSAFTIAFTSVIVLRIVAKKLWLKAQAIIPVGLNLEDIVSYRVWDRNSKSSISLISKGWYNDSRLLTYTCVNDSYAHLHLVQIDNNVIDANFKNQSILNGWQDVLVEVSDSDLSQLDSKLLTSCATCRLTQASA